MPIYEYRCAKGHLSEEISSEIKKDIVCPACGAKAHHVLSPPAIRFHGSGFYSTDYKKKKTKKD